MFASSIALLLALQVSQSNLTPPVESTAADEVLSWVDIDLDKVGGLPDFFSNLSAWAERVEFAGRADLDRAIDEANRAMASYRDKLRAMPTTRNFHLGTDTTRRIVALRGIELSLEELHGIARDFLAENTASVEAMRQTLARKYSLPTDITAEALQRHLNGHYAVAREGTDLELILDEYRAERDKILAFVKERDLFPVPDAQDMKILRTPAFMAPSIPAGAMESPPPFREGVRTSTSHHSGTGASIHCSSEPSSASPRNRLSSSS